MYRPTHIFRELWILLRLVTVNMLQTELEEHPEREREREAYQPSCESLQSRRVYSLREDASND